MHSAMFAICWSLWLRYRVPLIGALVWFVAVCAIFPLWPGGPSKIAVDLFAIVPFVAAFLMGMAIVSLGTDADVSARRSGFPSRFFTLPVPTLVLVAPLLLLGTLGAVGGWLVLSGLVIRLTAPQLPFWGLAALLGVVVSWCQAIVWTPFRVPFLRPFVFVLGFFLVILTLAASERLGVSERTAVLLLTPLVPLGYLVAWRGVVRARRGEVPEWPLSSFPLSSGLPWSRPFPTALSAQVWLDSHWSGLLFLVPLAIFYAVVLPLFPIMEGIDREYTTIGLSALLPGVGVSASTTAKFLAVLPILPIIVALAGGLERPRGSRKYHSGLTPFAATRPLSNAALAAARYVAVGRAALGSGVLLVLACTVWVIAAGKWSDLAEMRTAWLPDHTWAGVAGLLLFTVIFSTLLVWGGLTNGVALGLTGRTWFVATVLATVGAIMLTLVAVLLSLLKSDPLMALALVLWVARIALVIKGLAVVTTTWAVLRQRVLAPRTLASILGVWTAATLGLFAAVWWLLPPGVISLSWLLGLVVLLVPLTRPLVGPLAVAWDRHR